MTQETPKILPLPNGPLYLLVDSTPRPVPEVRNARGEPCATGTGVALCRCGASSRKPFCDGSHGRIGFREANPEPVPSPRPRSYTSGPLAVHDDRARCSHVKLCTQRLPQVFRFGERPWIQPDRADVQAVIEAVRRCPSGALSYSLAGVSPGDPVPVTPAPGDPPTGSPGPEPRVTVLPDGPLAVTGGIELLGMDSSASAAGASGPRYTLCRCGASKRKPFCDGTHVDIAFQDPGV